MRLITFLFVSLINFACLPGMALANVTSSGGIFVNQNGNLSIEIKQVPLVDVVKAIKRQTNIEFKIRTNANPKVTCRFVNLPIKQGLKRLFRDLDYVLIHRDKQIKNQPGKIESIILLSRSLNTKPVAQAEQKTIAQVSFMLQQDLNNPDPEIRRKAILSMVDADIETHFSDITAILINDPDENVRAEASQAIASYDNEQIVSILVDALSDESDTVRDKVIDALGVIDTEEASQAFQAAVASLDLR